MKEITVTETILMISESIKKIRLENNVTQKDLAEAAHVSVKTVMNWEAGKTEPKASEMLSIANKLGVSIESIYGEEEINENETLYKIKAAIKQFTSQEVDSLNIILEGMFLRHQSNQMKMNLKER